MKFYIYMMSVLYMFFGKKISCVCIVCLVYLEFFVWKTYFVMNGFSLVLRVYGIGEILDFINNVFI